MAKPKNTSRAKSSPVNSGDRDRQGSNITGRGEVEEPTNSKTTLRLDSWQKEVLEYNGNIALRAGRQVGKSTIIAMKAGELAINNPKTSIMIISATERQAYLLFQKVLMYLDDNYRTYIRKGKSRQGQVMRPTKTNINLNNGSIIRCLPTGLDGLGIRGYTIDWLIADEAAFIPEDVWPAVTPMMSTTGGKIILLSTPFGKLGYFYERFMDNDFKKWHINAQDVAEKRLEPQRSYLQHFHEKERGRMTKLQYAQEYLGDFVDELRQIFSNEVLKFACTLSRNRGFLPSSSPHRDYFLGVDIARMGDDSGTYEVISRIAKDNFQHVENIVTTKKYTTETFDRIVELNKLWNFKKIAIDAGSGSLGVGILDFLLREPTVKKKVIAINNLSRSLDYAGERRRAILKEDLYFNLLAMLEKGTLKLLDDDEVIASLRSVQYEYTTGEKKKVSLKIFGKNTHIAEGLTRAAWLANAKHLNLSITWV